MNQIYLDHAATTPPLPEVCDTMISYMKSEWGNPSSLYDFSDEPRRAVLDARAHTAALIHADPKRIFFTSGGSESDSWALIGCARLLRCKGNHIIVSAIEHHAILHATAFLEDEGFEVTYLMPDAAGFIHPENLLKAMRPDTILVSIMMANNEIGTIQPISDLAYIAHTNGCEGCLFHTDAVQAYGQIPIDVKRLGVDLLSASAHKIYGPKGIGLLYIRDGVTLTPLIFGGGQESGIRGGTENVPAIAGLGEAAEEIYENLDEKRAHLYGLKQRFIDGIEKLEGTHVNGKTGEDSAPHIVSVSFEGIRSEVLLHSLEDRGIYVSSGSACSSNNHAGKQKGSKTLRNIHLKENLLDSTLRFSFSVHTTEEEIDYALEVLGELLPVLKKYTRH